MAPYRNHTYTKYENFRQFRHFYQPRSEGDNRIGSVCPSVCTQIFGAQRLILGARLCRVQQRAKKSHNQSEDFVCVSNNRADAVDQLLIGNTSTIPEESVSAEILEKIPEIAGIVGNFHILANTHRNTKKNNAPL